MFTWYNFYQFYISLYCQKIRFFPHFLQMAGKHSTFFLHKDSTCYDKWLRVSKWQGVIQFKCVLWQKVWKSNILEYFSKTAGKTFNFLVTKTLHTSWWVNRVVTLFVFDQFLVSLFARKWDFATFLTNGC